MMPRPVAGRGISRRLGLIAFVVISMLGVVLWLGPSLTGTAPPAYPPPTGAAAADRPIAAEAHVFRLSPGDVAVDTVSPRRASAHPRTLAMHRAIRAYPGAPPRIPHGLTLEEYRSTGCNACHERGGYSDRFAAYAPVTPHPELTDCLQCHVVNATLVGVSFPDPGQDALCLQCHVRRDPNPSYAMGDWRPLAWPEINQTALDGSPPLIPHDLQLRGTCLACHLGPGAVAEIRTSHPEQANCRQCHVPAALDEGVFTRPQATDVTATGGGP